MDRIAPDSTPVEVGGAPIQPTGSGVADLEVAYEQMRLAEGVGGSTPPGDDDATADGDVAESEAHPS